ncbi:MAG: 2-amino-4-hydroxy-6-hydroxymethyldihydropteridine diphosphokinase [Anaerolineae bacterium]
MSTIYLSLGSNEGDRLTNIKKALRMLESQVDVRSVSSVYETEPWGLRNQPWFLNVVCSGETDLTPHALLDFVKDIERRLGRQQTIRYGPRRLDIDILFYGHQVIRRTARPEPVEGRASRNRNSRLEIPHLRLADRSFVLVPLAEIAPELEHPETGKTASVMLAELEEPEVVRKYVPG